MNKDKILIGTFITGILIFLVIAVFNYNQKDEYKSNEYMDRNSNEPNVITTSNAEGDSDEMRYLKRIQRASVELERHTRTFEELESIFVTNPDIVWQDWWLDDMADAMNYIYEIWDVIEKMEPVDGLEGIDEHLNDAAYHFKGFLESYILVIDFNDEKAFYKAMEFKKIGLHHLELAEKEIIRRSGEYEGKRVD